MDLPPEFPSIEDVVPHDTNPLVIDEIIVETLHPEAVVMSGFQSMIQGIADVTDEEESHHMLSFQFLQPCLDQEEDMFLEGIDHFTKEFSPLTFPMEEENDTPA